jgi:di/tricarboxylate transporter
MSDLTLTLLVLGVTLVLFLWGKWEPDLVGVGSLVALYLVGVVSLPEAFSGFANSTVILIAALFVVGEGLSRTGVTGFVGERLIGSAGGSLTRLIVFTMLATALLSAFISNAGTVAALMPAAVVAAWGVNGTPSQILIPLAFAANVGGLLTLTGTPPNIVVSDALAAAGFEAFGFFEFSLVGLPLLGVVMAYMLTVGRRLVPGHRSGVEPPQLDQEMDELAASYAIEGGLYRLRVRRASPLRGESLRSSNLGRRFGVTVLDIRAHPHPERIRDEREDEFDWQAVQHLPLEASTPPDPDQVFDVNDVLLVRGTVEQIRRLEFEMLLGVLPVGDAGHALTDLMTREIGIAEIVLTTRSSYIGKSVADGSIGRTYGVQILGLKRGERQVPTDQPLQFGDGLLVRGTWEAIGRMAEEKRNFVVVGQPDEVATQVTEFSSKSWLAVGILVAMVGLMVSGLMPVVMAALLAAGAMLISGCLTKQQAYRAISWSTVILIAAMIPMAVALERTGAAGAMADLLVEGLGGIGPVAVLIGVMVATSLLSQVISNTASAVLMSPIVLGAAAGLGVDPRPLFMGLAVAASSAFMTPIGTAPNLMVMAPGGYGFRHYLRVGGPLVVLFLAVGAAIIPFVWEF